MAGQIVPVTNDAHQSLTISLSIDGGIRTLQLAFKYSEMADYWIMSVRDQAGSLQLDSIPVLPSPWPAANFLAPYAYLGIGSCQAIALSSTTGNDIRARNLGSDFMLIWDDTV